MHIIRASILRSAESASITASYRGIISSCQWLLRHQSDCRTIADVMHMSPHTSAPAPEPAPALPCSLEALQQHPDVVGSQAQLHSTPQPACKHTHHRRRLFDPLPRHAHHDGSHRSKLFVSLGMMQVHGSIGLHRGLVQIIGTRPFQRLANLYQLGATHYVSAAHLLLSVAHDTGLVAASEGSKPGGRAACGSSAQQCLTLSGAQQSWVRAHIRTAGVPRRNTHAV